eukprot:CAMPEP_0182416470 /NCGR_PEP_ID=MMETSP1167-20130531/760_1 /TAXON_ID=2988 /ORGANISM="Mallomonas Sp, Strain CCMP3275" /LENGTH=303 /DNA_ID=CAMNT_0024589241 /DNA_START=190 /DNA_END=1101 /DNA_ORIENTATION=+
MIFSVLLISTLSLIIVSILAEKVKLTVSDGKVVKEAEFALRELQKLSDSEVYESLSISKIVNAESEIGIFHFNMMLTIELTSPYFASGQLTESYKIIIMTHKEDGVKSFAINEFPVMTEDAIETYWIRKVERKRREREESFRRMEIESILLDDWKGTNRKDSHDDPSPGEEEEEEEEEEEDMYLEELQDEELTQRREQVSEQSLAQLLEEVQQLEERRDLREARQLESRNMQLRLVEPYMHEEYALSEMSLLELFQITVGEREGTDYQKYRAQQLLDQTLLRFQTNKRKQFNKEKSIERHEEL